MTKMQHLFRKQTRQQTTSNQGFSLVELIIVIAIMAVLIVIAVPAYTKYMHKSRVTTDWSNLKKYYDEIQADFVSTGEYNPKVLTVDQNISSHWSQREIVSLDGQTVKMQAGFFAVTKESSGLGYQIVYYCDKCASDPTHYDSCELSLGTR